MKTRKFRISKLEFLLALAAVLSLVVPVYLKLANGWNPLASNEQTMILVIRATTAKSDSLNLEKYCIEGVATNVTALPTPRSMSQDLFRFDNSGIKIINDGTEGLIEISKAEPSVPVRSFNEKILLITGRPSVPSTNAVE